MIAAILLACTPVVTDGDTLRCGGERIRLVGIDAAELAGHCRRGRKCVTGDPIRARQSLARAIGNHPLRITRLGRDHYGRTIAAVMAGGVDLSCYQLRAGLAIYVARWDTGGTVAQRCKSYSQAIPSPSRSRLRL